MPLYYFHLRNGADVLLGEDGAEFPDDDSARAAALRDARAIIAADAREGLIDLSQRIDVLDADGAVVLALPFTAAVTIKGA